MFHILKRVLSGDSDSSIARAAGNDITGFVGIVRHTMGPLSRADGRGSLGRMVPGHGLRAARRSRRRAKRYAGFAVESLEPRCLLATITVDSLADNLATDNRITLREAIEAANTDTSIDGSPAGSGHDTIVFDIGPSFTTDQAEWDSLVTSPEVFPFMSRNVEQARELEYAPAPRTALGHELTFDAEDTGLSGSFRLIAGQFGAEFIFADEPNGSAATPFRNALSIGAVGQFQDDDFEIRFDGAAVYSFGLMLNGNDTVTGERLTIFNEDNESIGATTGIMAASGKTFIGVISAEPIARAEFESDNTGDDIALAAIHLSTIEPDVETSLIVLTRGELQLTNDVTIIGPGSEQFAIDTRRQSRIFNVAADVTAAISNLTLQRARISDDDGGAIDNFGILTLNDLIIRDSDLLQSVGAFHGGAAIANEPGGTAHLRNVQLLNNFSQGNAGGIYNFGTMTIEASVISDNISTLDNGTSSGGGGVRNTGDLTIIDTILEGNSASRDGGAIASRSGTVRVLRSALIGNDARRGGGIHNFANSTIIVSETAIEANFSSDTSDGRGGGIYNAGAASIRRSTVADNYAPVRGGGIYNSAGRVEIQNSTVSGNGQRMVNGTTQTTGSGGGIYNEQAGTVALNNATLTGNRATVVGGGMRNLAAHLELGNTIVWGNQAQSSRDIAHGVVDGVGSIVDLGHNLLSANVGSIEHGINGNLVGIDPKLDPALRNNGGFTRTHAVQPDSPVIDAGNDDFNPYIDQRGLPVTDVADDRTTGTDVGIVDIGAYELQRFESSQWNTFVNGASQFDQGPASVTGFGFEAGSSHNAVRSDPVRIGFTPFDTGALSFGTIVDGLFGDRYGAEVRASLAGAVGLEVGLYFNSGSVDVDYHGSLNYLIDRLAPDEQGRDVYGINTSLSIDDGSIYTLSPQFGFYVDAVLDLTASIGATGCYIACVQTSPDPGFAINETIELIAINRQAEDDFGNVDFDGEVRYVGDAIVNSANSLLDIRQYQKGTEEERAGENEKSKAEKKLRNSKTDDEWQQARDEIQQADKAIETARKKQRDANDDVTRRNFSKPGGLGLGVGFGEAEGPLLGAQATITAGAALDGILGGTVEIGTLAATLPDIQLRDHSPAADGTLTASTDDFTDPELNARRQVLRASLDLGGLLGAIAKLPVGKLNAFVGPLGLSVQTVSYNLAPTLNVTQDITANTSARNYVFRFDAAIDAEVVSPDGTITELTAVTEVPFAPGDALRVHTDTEIEVTPSVTLANRFHNRVGLDLDLTGELEAFAFEATVGGETIIDVDPLITHKHNLVSAPIATLLDRTFDLVGDGTDETGLIVQELAPFTIGGDADMDGGSPGTPLPVPADDVAVVDGEVIYVAASLLTSEPDPSDPSQQINYDFGGLEFNITNDGQQPAELLEFVIIFHDGVTIETLSGGNIVETFVTQPGDSPAMLTFTTQVDSFRIIGFTPSMIPTTGKALVGLIFNESGQPDIGVTGLDRTRRTPAEIEDGEEGADDVAVRLLNTVDVDKDGQSLPLSDGVMLVRYLDGIRGQELLDGAVNPAGERTTVEEIEKFLEDTLRHVLVDEETGEESDAFDVDNNGLRESIRDGRLHQRYLAGFSGTEFVTDALGQNAVRTEPVAIRNFLDLERSNANNKPVTLNDEDGVPRTNQGSGFGIDEIVDRTGGDVFGTDRVTAVEDSTASGSAAHKPISTSPPGASAASPARSAQTRSSHGESTFDFALENFGNAVTYERVSLRDADTPADRDLWQLVSRTAEGSPREFGPLSTLDEFRALTPSEKADQISGRLVMETETSRLGIDDPMFVEIPDAAAHHFAAPDGYRFTSLIMNPDVGGNLYLEKRADLYVPQSNQWFYDVPLTESFAFPEAAAEFVLVALKLPNVDLHRAFNQKAPGVSRAADGSLVYHLPTTYGITLDGPTDGQPVIRVMQAAEDARQTLHTPANLIKPDECPPEATNCTNAFGTDAEFRIVRNGTVAEVYLRDLTTTQPATLFETVQLAAATGFTAEGDENLDRVMLDVSAGPLRLPLTFHGGDDFPNSLFHANDELVVSGSGATIDITRSGETRITGVERIDIRGDGDNRLILNAAALADNSGTDNTLLVLRDDGDTVDRGIGWTSAGTEIIAIGATNVTFDVWRQAYGGMDVILKESVPSTVPVSSSAVKVARSSSTFESRYSGGHTTAPFTTAPFTTAPFTTVSLATVSFTTVSLAESDVVRPEQTTSASVSVAAVSETALGSPTPRAGESTAQQSVTTTPPNPILSAGARLDLDFNYETLNSTASGSTGLVLGVHYDSSRLTFETISGIHQTALDAFQEKPEDYPDGVSATDRMLLIQWVDFASPPIWPAASDITRLFTISFTAAADFSGTTIQVTGSPAAGFDLITAPVVVTAVGNPPSPVNLDADDDQSTQPLSDGILIVRHLGGFTGTTLTDGTANPQGRRTVPATIGAFLDQGRSTMLDVDADGQALPLSDGILILRYLAGFTGTTLTTGTVNPAGTRTDSADIVAFLDGFRPSIGGATSQPAAFPIVKRSENTATTPPAQRMSSTPRDAITRHAEPTAPLSARSRMMSFTTADSARRMQASVRTVRDRATSNRSFEPDAVDSPRTVVPVDSVLSHDLPHTQPLDFADSHYESGSEARRLLDLDEVFIGLTKYGFDASSAESACFSNFAPIVGNRNCMRFALSSSRSFGLTMKSLL